MLQKTRTDSPLKLDLNNIPKHIAIIMDGNRRWAKKRELTATEGHKAGAENLVDIVDYCEKIGIKHLTVYALSTENWRKRAEDEVKGLFGLLIKIVREKANEYKRRGVRFFVIGNYKAFPHHVRNAVRLMLKIVKKRESMRFNVALNYGGRDELIRAIRRIVKDKVKPNDIDEDLICRYLDTSGQPDPDMIIRTGGEIRLSNFLNWQMSYAELFFSDILWPDFTPKELEKTIREFQSRQRRLGA